MLAVAAGCVLAGTRRSTAAVRYRLLFGLLFLFLAICGLTFLYELYLAGEIGGVREPGNVAADSLAVGSSILRRYCEANAEWIVWAWFAVTAIKAVRMAGGWGYMRAISRHGHTEAPEQWVQQVARWAGQLGIPRRVRLLESRLVQAPMVLGHLKPVIFVPLGLINHLPPDEIELVLLHELAHIRRHDYLVNMIQQLAECVLFFNPGLLWVSSLLREERENCCDDIAIARTGDRVGLVRALVRIKEHSMGVAVLAFRPGGKRQLLRRVLRIAQQRNLGLNGGERVFLTGSCVVLLLLLLSFHRVGSGAIVESREVAQGQATDGHPAAVIAGVKAPEPELMAVLRARQQVAQNMEWVGQQLTLLHQHKVKTGQGQARRKKSQEVQASSGQEQQDHDKEIKTLQENEEVLKKQAEARLDLLQGQRDREQGERNREEDEQNRLQAEQNRKQEELNRLQVARDGEQVEQERVRAEIERIQVERDREQAGRDQVQAELDRAQADRDRQQAERDREQAERDRQQAVRDRQLTEQLRQQAGMQRNVKSTVTVAVTTTKE